MFSNPTVLSFSLRIALTGALVASLLADQVTLFPLVILGTLFANGWAAEHGL